MFGIFRLLFQQSSHTDGKFVLNLTQDEYVIIESNINIM